MYMEMEDVYDEPTMIWMGEEDQRSYERYDGKEKQTCRDKVISFAKKDRGYALILDNYARMTRQMRIQGWRVEDILVVEKAAYQQECQARLRAQVCRGEMGEVLSILPWIGELSLVWLDYCYTIFNPSVLNDTEMLLRRAAKHGNAGFALAVTVCCRGDQLHCRRKMHADVRDVGAVLALMNRSEYGMEECVTHGYYNGGSHMLMIMLRLRRYYLCDSETIAAREGLVHGLSWYWDRAIQCRS